VIRVSSRYAAWRQAWLGLALLALALNILVPAGFMPGRAGPGPAASFPLVLCTGHGAVTVDGAAAPAQGPQSKKAPRQAPSDSPCAFAGHGAGGEAPRLLAFEAIEFVAYQRPARRSAPRDIAPGRGLAAPPLPARGPPILLI
jgi:hypothetical protein